MKKLVLLLAIIPFISFAQQYSEVVSMPGKTAEQLYVKAREWFAESFISADNALLMDDRISGRIIAKGSIPVLNQKGKLGWYANFTIKVSFKDGKYKNEVSNISVLTVATDGGSDVTTPFSAFLDKKEYYQNASDFKWIMKNPPEEIALETDAAKELARKNKSIYDLIIKTELEMKDLLSNVQSKMKETEASW